MLQRLHVRGGQPVIVIGSTTVRHHHGQPCALHGGSRDHFAVRGAVRHQARPARNPANQAGPEIASMVDPRTWVEQRGKFQCWRGGVGLGAAEGGLSGGISAQQGMEPADEASGSGAPRCGSGAAFRAKQRAGKSRSRRAERAKIRRSVPCAAHGFPRRAAPRSAAADNHEAPLTVRGCAHRPPGRPGAARPGRHRSQFQRIFPTLDDRVPPRPDVQSSRPHSTEAQSRVSSSAPSRSLESSRPATGEDRRTRSAAGEDQFASPACGVR